MMPLIAIAAPRGTSAAAMCSGISLQAFMELPTDIQRTSAIEHGCVTIAEYEA